MRLAHATALISLLALAVAVPPCLGADYAGTTWSFPVVKSTLKYEVDKLDEKGKTKALLPDIQLTIHDGATWSAALDLGDTISGSYSVTKAGGKTDVLSLKFDTASIAVMKDRYEDDLEDLFGVPVQVKDLKFKSAKVTFKKKDGGVVAAVRLRPSLSGSVKVGAKWFSAAAKGEVTGKSDLHAP